MKIETMYEKNKKMEIVHIRELDYGNQIYLRAFFRRIGLPHVYTERVVPTFKKGQSLIVAAVTRLSTPKGVVDQRIHALIHIYPWDEDTMYLSTVFVSNENLTNVGLMAAVYKEALQELVRQGKTKVGYLVHEGSVLAPWVITSHGFKQSSKESYEFEEGRYNLWQADPKSLLERTGLAKTSSKSLLAYDTDDDTFMKVATFQGTLQLVGRVSIHEIPPKPWPPWPVPWPVEPPEPRFEHERLER